MAKEKQEAKPEEKEEEQQKYFVGEVPTQTAPVIVDRESNTQYSVELALAKIMNDIEELKKGLL
jgi:hypothetical protein